MCVANNNAGIAQGSAFIDVESKMNIYILKFLKNCNIFLIGREAPIIEIHPNKASTVVAGSNFVVQCRITAGFPQPSVHWSRADGRPLSNSVEQLSNGVLRYFYMQTFF